MLSRIQAAFRAGQYETGPHALIRQLGWGIGEGDIIEAVGNDAPEIIEDYPGDPRGHSCLIRGEARRRVLHIVCTIDEPIFLITCYEPDPRLWDPGFRSRRK